MRVDAALRRGKATEIRQVCIAAGLDADAGAFVAARSAAMTAAAIEGEGRTPF
jgi:hypothetical protein